MIKHQIDLDLHLDLEIEKHMKNLFFLFHSVLA